MGLLNKGAAAQRKMDSYRRRGELEIVDRALAAANIRSFVGQVISASIDICLSYDGCVLEEDDGILLAWPCTVKDGPDDILVGLHLTDGKRGTIAFDVVCTTETDEEIGKELRQSALKAREPQIKRMVRFLTEMLREQTPAR